MCEVGRTKLNGGNGPSLLTTGTVVRLVRVARVVKKTQPLTAELGRCCCNNREPSWPREQCCLLATPSALSAQANLIIGLQCAANNSHNPHRNPHTNTHPPIRSIQLLLTRLIRVLQQILLLPPQPPLQSRIAGHDHRPHFRVQRIRPERIVRRANDRNTRAGGAGTPLLPIGLLPFRCRRERDPKPLGMIRPSSLFAYLPALPLSQRDASGSVCRRGFEKAAREEGVCWWEHAGDAGGAEETVGMWVSCEDCAFEVGGMGLGRGVWDGGSGEDLGGYGGMWVEIAGGEEVGCTRGIGVREKSGESRKFGVEGVG